MARCGRCCLLLLPLLAAQCAAREPGRTRAAGSPSELRACDTTGKCLACNAYERALDGACRATGYRQPIRCISGRQEGAEPWQGVRTVDTFQPCSGGERAGFLQTIAFLGFMFLLLAATYPVVVYRKRAAKRRAAAATAR